MKYQAPRGTNDILPIESKVRYWIQKKLYDLVNTYNFQEISTPIFENYELFQRAVGEETDIVNKEMFIFSDRKERKLVLRPENTASIVRAFINNNLKNSYGLPLKLFYYGSMFRYERPQAGRRRQFLQFGVEVFGEKSIYCDAEVISLALDILKKLNIKNYKLKINFLADKKVQKKYRLVLKNFFEKNNINVCKDCKVRINKNPLRVLDCKIDSNINNLPIIKDYWTTEQSIYFENLLNLLLELNIEYEVDYNLVRGLDYYNDVVFEIINLDKEQKGQNTLIGGGRYDNLVSQLSNESVSCDAIGFAVGIERILLALSSQQKEEILKQNYLDVYIMTLTKSSYNFGLKILQMLRNNNITSDMNYQQKNLKLQFNLANKYNSKYIVIIGDEEIKQQVLTVKQDLIKRELKVPVNELINFIKNNMEEKR